jgi:hypothetical protein
MEMLQIRVADPPLLRLTGKCLHVGVLDGEQSERPDEGTAQGSIISPMLGNVYLHYALDLWFERDIKPRLKGSAQLIRYADDFIIGFQRQDDAKRVLDVLHRRMAKYGLTLHPDKTRLIPFARPRPGANDGSRPGTFDFLGFTMYWCRTRRGGWRLGMKTRKACVQRTLTSLGEWCRRHRHLPLKDQHAALSRRLRGHYQYFGVEAGRDGFWIHRFLKYVGVESHVVDSARKEVKRRGKRRKTDRLDLGALLRLLIRYWGGEKKVWSVVRVPSPEAAGGRRTSGAGADAEPERGAESGAGHRQGGQPPCAGHGHRDRLGVVAVSAG